MTVQARLPLVKKRQRRSPAKIALLLLALICGTAAADVYDGVAAYQRGDYASAFSEFSIAAGQDDAFSQNVLGTMYAQGHGVERNYKLAMDWFFKAQALGSPEAMSNLAKMYESGLGIPQNNTAALQYYRDAARAGFQPAILRMAEIYTKGDLGVTPDIKTALDWRGRLRGRPTKLAAQPTAPLAGSRARKTQSAALPKAADRDKAILTRLEKGWLFEKQLWQRLDNYRHSERKLFVASTDGTPSLAAYLKALRVQLQRLPATAFSSSTPDQGMIVTLAIRRDGALREIELNRGSGNADNDRRVLSSLRKLEHFKPLPAETEGSADVLVVSVRLPITFPAAESDSAPR